MGPYPTGNQSAPSLDDAPSSRSFFSRFSLPLRSRASRNITDFHIRPSDPHRRYAAGDHVHGAVVLTIVKPMRITHLTVSLHGYVRVYKGPTGGANEPTVNPAQIPTLSGSTRFRYLGNGHASLFQDEQVLSGDGKLDAGKYEFNFDLMFPSKSLPSSIDFERGTISYMITATLTRPGTISPTTSCERKIFLVDRVDVGPLAPPRARTIYLEPISRRSKKKRAPEPDREKAGLENLDATAEPRQGESVTDGSHTGTTDDLSQDSTHNNPRSPIPSDIRSVSDESAISGSTGFSRVGEVVAGTSTSSQGNTRIAKVEERTITATIELLKGGCLPGDLVPIKVSVQHIKRIKSMHGVIVTLYRQGRIDSAPPVSLFKELTKEEAKRLEKDEFYPKSKTGLGGLSLTSAGPCSVFRKDLSQSFSPLIIDPGTLSADVNAKVRVPADAFPTIKGVPGEMISFKYQLEVLIDLGGKLANQLQGGNPSSGGGVGGQNLGTGTGAYEGGMPNIGWGGGPSLIDTDRLRREKGVVTVIFELIVGTTDTARIDKRGRAVVTSTAVHIPEHTMDSDLYAGETPSQGFATDSGDHTNGRTDMFMEAGGQSQSHIPESPPPIHPYWNPLQTRMASAPEYVPPPQIPEESGLSEKERIRQAEQRLLPSHPEPGPEMAVPATESSSSAMVDGHNIYDAEDTRQTFANAAPQGSTRTETEPEASAPTLADLTTSSAVASADDKQERERQRLLAEASSPPEFPEDYEHDGGGPSTAVPSAPPLVLEPSAPALSDEHEYGTRYTYMAPPSPHMPSAPSEPLPRYER